MKTIALIVLLSISSFTKPCVAGNDGGGGSEEGKTFAAIARKEVNRIRQNAEFRKFGDQLLTTLTDPKQRLEILLVDSLQNACDGKALGSFIAYSCPHLIYLKSDPWKSWLSQTGQANLDLSQVIHEVSRASDPNDPGFVSNDGGWKLTTAIYQDPLAQPSNRFAVSRAAYKQIENQNQSQPIPTSASDEDNTLPTATATGTCKSNIREMTADMVVKYRSYVQKTLAGIGSYGAGLTEIPPASGSGFRVLATRRSPCSVWTNTPDQYEVALQVDLKFVTPKGARRSIQSEYDWFGRCEPNLGDDVYKPGLKLVFAGEIQQNRDDEGTLISTEHSCHVSIEFPYEPALNLMDGSGKSILSLDLTDGMGRFYRALMGN